MTYPFPNFNSETVEVWEWISNFISHITRHAGFKVDPYQQKELQELITERYTPWYCVSLYRVYPIKHANSFVVAALFYLFVVVVVVVVVVQQLH